MTAELFSYGLLITDDIARYFAEHFDEVWVSLDGTEEEHDKHRLKRNGEGTWAKVVEAIRKLERYGVKHAINCVVSKDSKYSLDKYEQILIDMFPHAGVSVLYEIGMCTTDKSAMATWLTAPLDWQDFP